MLGSATTTALMGKGFPGEVANVIGCDYALVKGVGTAQVGAAVIPADNVELSATGGQTAVILPTNQVVAECAFLVNPSATTALVFVPVGHTLNGTLNGSLSIATNKAAIMYQYKNKFWASLLTA